MQKESCYLTKSWPGSKLNNFTKLQLVLGCKLEDFLYNFYMFSTCFYYGKSQTNFNEITSRIFSINSSANIIRFTNIFHLLTTLRCYEYFIEETKEGFPTHIFIDENPGSSNYINFIATFERLRLESHKIHELSIVPIFTNASASGDRSSVLELEYVYQYIESNNFELYDNSSCLTYLN